MEPMQGREDDREDYVEDLARSEQRDETFTKLENWEGGEKEGSGGPEACGG